MVTIAMIALGGLALFASETCLSYRLAQYFGDEQAPRQCGHCSVCAGQVAYLPEPPALSPLVDYLIFDVALSLLSPYFSFASYLLCSS